MSLIRTNFLALVYAALIGGSYAQTSLYIPGFDPQPLSVNQLGVGSDGRTTWEIQVGVTSGTYDDIGFVGTATLIEGPSDAHIVYTYPAAQLGIDESCAISGNLAVCTVLAASGSLATETAVETESVVPFEVQGGVAAASASAGSSPVASTPVPSGSSAASASSKSSGSSGPSQTSGTSVSPSTTGSGGANGAVVHLPSVALTLCAAALGGFVFAGW